MTFWSLLTLTALACGCLLAGRVLIHYFQLESYQFPGYFRALRRNAPKSLLIGALMTVALLGGAALFAWLVPENNDWLPAVAESAWLLLAGWMIRLATKEKNTKKPLRFTPRLKRLYGITFAVFLLLLILFSQAGGSAGAPGRAGLPPLFFLCAGFPLLLPLWIALGGLIAWPVEKIISELYFRDAQRILRERNDLIRIGITGSWGKTSVKFILGTLLEEKYHTLVTPASFNTPMGVTKVIRTQLEPGHRVFIAEMGARHVGDIREMCRLVHPVLGLLTSVGEQHLDTFKTVERVAKTKYELVDALPKNGTAFFADDGGICLSLHEKTKKNKWLAGLDAGRDDVWAEDIRVSPQGSSFVLCHGADRIACTTRLLGELNIRNVTLCAAVCLHLGMTLEQISRGIGKLQPVEHRLQLISNPGGLSVIDDAFNSNIRGAEQAFSVLKAFPGRRIAITPGMVELGDQEAELNRRLGEKLADSCDVAVLVGARHTEPIQQGLKEKGFPADSLIVVSSLAEAAEWLKANARPGDTVLFENDLPDQYSET